ncbi:zinc-binding dehydrogenase [Micromonospora sp. NPDC051925]|uniref:zinc-binding dehydrogenase n=1 Tax=Micromonospora sp. NPDC051925 TaxID=3364288 RepID=UPI0037C54D9A
MLLHHYDPHTTTPLVPGHEFTGVVTETGPEVTTFATGDRVAVGNIVDSCGTCAMCRAGQQNFCHSFPTLTYGGTDRQDGSTTLGGLGHLAVKLAVALGATTTVLSRTKDKRDDAHRLGAHDLIDSTDTRQLATARDTFDVVIDTISAPHDLAPYLKLVAMDGTLSLLGHLGAVTVEATDLLIGRKKLSSAGSAGRPATAEMLQFCADNTIAADIEVLPSARLDTALDRLRRNDVRYRFVLDLSDLD